MDKGGHKLARARIPELGTVIRARREDPSAVGAEHRFVHAILMVEGGKEFAYGSVPKLGGLVRARRENPSTVRTERRVLDLTLMGEGNDGQRQRLFATLLTGTDARLG